MGNCCVAPAMPGWWQGAGWYEAEYPDGYDEATWVADAGEALDVAGAAAREGATVTFCGDASLPAPVCRVAARCLAMLGDEELRALREWESDLGVSE